MPDVDWPDGFERTSEAERERYPHGSGFRVDRTEAFQNILEQLKLLGAEEVRIDSGAHEKTVNPNLLTQESDPDDPSVVVYFSKDGQDFAVPCDKWDNVRDNAQAIANYLDSKRALDRYGVKTVESEFTTQKLPPGEEHDPASEEAASGEDEEGFGDKPPHKVLGVASDADDAQIKAAARALKKEYHPDAGGNTEKFNQVLEAEEVLLGGRG